MTQLDDDPAHAIPANRRLKRSRGRWRLLAFVLAAVAVLALTVRFVPAFGPGPERVARIKVEGAITTNAERRAAIAHLAEDDSIRAVLVSINSPGGSTAGGEELYEGLRRLSEEKPVVAVINELGASAAYMTALGTERIFARRLSIVGSIGVLYQHVNAGGLMDKIGIDLDKVASGELKAEPDLDEPMTPRVRASLDALVQDSFEWFVDIVAERRGLERDTALALSDGRVITGRMGVETGLIDAVGGEIEARTWLSQTYGVGADLPTVDAFPRPGPGIDWLSLLFGRAMVQTLGFDPAARGALDGLVSLWHPSSS